MKLRKLLKNTELESLDFDNKMIKVRQYDKELLAIAELLDEPDYACLKLSADQVIPNNAQTIALFNTFDASESTRAADFNALLNKLDLSYANGGFTNTDDKANTLSIHYHLRFASADATRGYRQAMIVNEGGSQEVYARSATTAFLNEPTHLSGGTILRLKKGESFTIKVSHNNGSDVVLAAAKGGNASKLVIVQV